MKSLIKPGQYLLISGEPFLVTEVTETAAYVKSLFTSLTHPISTESSVPILTEEEALKLKKKKNA